MREWEYNFIIFYLGIRWKRVVSFTIRPLYTRARNPRYKFDRLGGL
jgi:hypothetical protein